MDTWMASGKGKQIQEDAIHNGDDQSFRDSFYESGTDWSSLYEVDEFGMPLGDDTEGKDGRSSEDHSGNGSPHELFGTAGLALASSSGISKFQDGIVRQDTATINVDSTLERCNKGVADASTGFSFQRLELKKPKTGSRVGAPKFVQTDLSAFLGVKLKTSFGQPVNGKRQQDIGPYFGAPALPQEVPAKARKVNGKSFGFGKAAATRRDGGASNGVENVNDRQRLVRSCPFYKKIPGRKGGGSIS